MSRPAAVVDSSAAGSGHRPDVVRELISYFSEDPAAAAGRFRGQVVTVKGVVTDVRKSMFQALYDVNFRQLDTPLRVTASFRPPSEFTRVMPRMTGRRLLD